MDINNPPKKIKVVMDDNYPPYVFRDSKGVLQGILIDQWKLWEKKTGVSVEIYAMDWAEALRRMEAGHFDVIDTIFFTEKRARVFDYSKPYAKIDVSIFFHKDIPGIFDVHSLQGFMVAVKSGDAAIDYLKSKGIDTLKEFPSYEAIINAAKERKVNVAVIDNPPAIYFLYKAGILDMFRHTDPLYTGEFHRAVKKGNKALLLLVEDGFSKISEAELREINKKWFGTTEHLPFIAYLRYVAIGFGFFGLIVILMLIWNHILRKRVKERTAELEKEIAQKNKAIDALKLSEERYRTVIESSNDAITIVKNGCHVYVNKRFYEMTGYSEEEVINKPISNWIHPEDRERVKNMVILRESLKPVPSRYEFKGLRKDGSIIYIEVSATYINYMNETMSLAFLRDITDRKLAEEALNQEREKFSTLIENIPFGLAMLDKKGRYLFLNVRWKELFGYDPSEIPDGKTWFRKVFPDREYRRRAISAWIEDTSKAVKNTRTFTLTCKDGTQKIINFTFIPIQNDLYIITCEDVTELKRTEEQLIQSQKMEAIGRLAGGIAHDFNNMLTVILGHTQLAQLTLDTSNPLYQRFSDIQKAAQRSAELTKNLLAFARKQTIAPRVININHQIEDMLKMLRRLIGENIELIFIPQDHLWSIKIDPSQLNQIIINIVINAKDAIENLGTITIETHNVTIDEDYCKTHLGFIPGEYAMIAISDNGTGMDKEILEHIFEPFFTTKGIEKGSGLGLSTVYGIVKQNNGFINVYSEPKKGSTFKIYLPRHVGEDVKITTPEKHTIMKARGETVIIVEDEGDVLELCTSMLKELGYNVITASSPQEAINLSSRHKDIHLLLTDVIMPEMNGKELADKIKSIIPSIKCLFMSGYTTNAIVKNGILEEGVNYIQKPFSLQELSVKVREALE
ncbi:MAG TPA: PAS domain S-box protein, partial [Syntrophorhabdaceae bacterium]|nr:PAS domain S-box protein [Syntrophorhabdaceae bacterium]